VPHTLFVIHGSHPCATVERAFELKRVPFRRVELPPAVHVPVQRALFGGRTVPALLADGGGRVQGSRAIVRWLERTAPESPLFPPDPDARAAVEAAEAWGDETYQPVARRLLWTAFAASPRAMPSFQEGARVPLPTPAVLALAPLMTRIEQRLNDATRARAREDMRALPGHLDRIDAWLADGVLGGETANAADLQIAASSRLIMTIGDARPFFAGRPCEEHALRLFAQWDGSVPAGALPAEWLATAQTA
jgi:glutathione S-transferase